MPNVDRLDSLADLSALEKEKEQVLSGLKEIKDYIGKIGAIEFKAKGSKSMADNVKVTNELTAAMKEQQKIEKQLVETAVKIAALDTQMAKAVAIEKEELRKRNQELKNTIREEGAVKGSIEQRRAALIRLQKEYDNLAPKERESSRGIRLEKTVAGLTDQLKQLEGATGRFQRNVGNYNGSAKIIVDALERARQKFEGLKKSADATPAALERAKSEFEALRGVTDNKQFLSFAAGAGDATKEVRTFTRTLVNLEAQGLGNSEVANELRKRLAELTDTIADTRAEVKALSSDSRSFDLFASSVNFAVDVFQTAVGAMTAFGASEEDAAEATKTLLALQTLSNGVRGIANELTTKGTAANKLYAFAQKQVSLAFDETATASVRLKGALATIGIGAVILAVGYLIANINKLSEAEKESSRQHDLSVEVNKKAIEAYAEERAQIDLTVKQLQDENISRDDKKKLIDELQHKYPEYLGNIKNEGKLTEDLSTAIKDKLIPALELEAKAKAAQQLATEKYKKLLELQNEAIENGSTGVAFALQALGNVFHSSSITAKGYVGALQNTNKEVGKLQNGIDGLFKITLDADDQLQKLGGHVTDHQIKSNLIDLSKEIEARSKLIELIKQQQIERTKPTSDSTDVPESSRLKALQQAADLEKEIIQNRLKTSLQLNATEQEKLKHDLAEQLSNTKLTEKEKDEIKAQSASNERALEYQRKAIVQQTDDDLLNIEINYGLARGKVHAETLKQIKDDEKRTRDELLTIELEKIKKLQHDEADRSLERTKGRSGELKSLNDKYQKEIEATKEGSKAREKVERKYAENRADIEYAYGLAELKTQIEFAEKILAVRKAANQDITEDEKKLHELRLQLSDIETDHVIANNKRQTKSQREKFDDVADEIGKIKEVYTRVTDFIGGMLNASVERQKQAIQGQIEDIEKRKEIEIEAVNASTATEQEKADKIALINARAAAQKEQLERKQRQLDLQRARFEKAKAIGEIIINTALAVVKALPNIPRAIAIGAIGAAELAVAIATPLPKFKHGREGGPATWGITGDGGKQEVMTSPDLKQAILTPATNTLTYLPKDWKVFPDVDSFNEAALKMAMKPLPAIPVMQSEDGKWSKAVATEIRDLKEVVKNKPVAHITGNHAGVMGVLQYGSTWIEYIDQNVNF